MSCFFLSFFISHSDESFFPQFFSTCSRLFVCVFSSFRFASSQLDGRLITLLNPTVACLTLVVVVVTAVCKYINNRHSYCDSIILCIAIHLMTVLDLFQTGLHWAAKHGNDALVKMLAGTFKSDVNARTVRSIQKSIHCHFHGVFINLLMTNLLLRFHFLFSVWSLSF